MMGIPVGEINDGDRDITVCVECTRLTNIQINIFHPLHQASAALFLTVALRN